MSRRERYITRREYDDFKTTVTNLRRQLSEVRRMTFEVKRAAAEVKRTQRAIELLGGVEGILGHFRQLDRIMPIFMVVPTTIKFMGYIGMIIFLASYVLDLARWIGDLTRGRNELVVEFAWMRKELTLEIARWVESFRDERIERAREFDRFEKRQKLFEKAQAEVERERRRRYRSVVPG